MKKKISLILFAVIVIICFLYWQNIQVFYWKIFHKSGEVYRLNDNDKLDGEVYSYEAGQLVYKAEYNDGVLNGKASWYYLNGNPKAEVTFYNGLKAGLERVYYENGRLESKAFFKKNKLNGWESVYRENGSINYKSHWADNEHCGSFYRYAEGGQINLYYASGIDNDPEVANMFYHSEYVNNKPVKVIGNSFSSNVYSRGSDGSPMILRNDSSYKDIDDLFISVATPPYVKSSLTVRLNNVVSHYNGLKANTVRVPNAISKAQNYTLKVFGKLTDKNEKIVRVDSLEIHISKKP